MIKYHVNTTQSEMPMHVHQNIGSPWNAAEMRRHVKRTCFYAGLKSQTGMSLLKQKENVIWALLGIGHWAASIWTSWYPGKREF